MKYAIHYKTVGKIPQETDAISLNSGKNIYKILNVIRHKWMTKIKLPAISNIVTYLNIIKNRINIKFDTLNIIKYNRSTNIILKYVKKFKLKKQ